MRMTFTSLMTGASSPCLASISALISSNSCRTSTSPLSASACISSRPLLNSSIALAAGCSFFAAAPQPVPAAADAGGRGSRRLAVVLGDGVDDRGFRGDDRLDVVDRHELDVVHGEDVGRVRHRDRQRRARARQRNDLIFLRGFSGNELDDRRIDLELGERDRRDAVLLREERRDLLVLDVAELDQVVTEFSPVLALVVQRFLELLGCDALLLEEQLTDTYGHLSLSTF